MLLFLFGTIGAVLGGAPIIKVNIKQNMYYKFSLIQKSITIINKYFIQYIILYFKIGFNESFNWRYYCYGWFI